MLSIIKMRIKISAAGFASLSSYQRMSKILDWQ